jgi:outer membrane protein TolC
VFTAQDDIPQLNPASSIEEFLEYIDATNPGLIGVRRQLQADLTEAKVADALPDPNLMVDVQVQEVETRVGPQKQRLGVSQSLPMKRKRDLRAKVADARAAGTREQVEAVRLDLHQEFRTLYADYFLVGKKLVIHREHLDLLENLETVVDSKYRAGETSYANLVRIDLEKDKIREQIATYEEQGRSLLAMLNAVLARPPLTAISFPGSLHGTDEEWLLAIEQELKTKLAENNPVLRRLDETVRHQELAADLARQERVPDVKVGFDWINTGDARVAGVPGSGDDPFILKFGVDLPINRKKYQAWEQAARERALAAQDARIDHAIRLAAGLERAFNQYREASRKIELYRDLLIPKAMETLTVTQKAFVADVSQYLDVIDAEVTLLEFKITLHEAITGRMHALADIEWIAGYPLPPPPAGGHH